MKRQNVYIYAIEGKVIFPYHEYRFSINSNAYNPDLYDNLVGFVTKLDEYKDNKNIQKIDGFSRYGTLLKIQKSDIMSPHPFFERSKSIVINYLGLTFARFKIISLTKDDGRLTANIEILNDELTKDVQITLEKKNLIQNLKKQLKLYYECKMRNVEAESLKDRLDNESSVNKIIYKAISELDLTYQEKVKFLQLSKHQTRIETLITYLIEKTQNSKGVISIEEKVRKEMVGPKKKPIFQGTFKPPGYPGYPDKNDLTEKINSKNLPENVRAEIEKQMKNMGPGSSKSVAQKYIETLLQIPWLESTEDVKDINAAEKILNDDHTGLKDVKERILEFLAVKFRSGNSKGNILCLHGPPGVGKTSIAKSIAKALGKGFTRISLGGMNDQAELRGHRRTYVAALPGAIIRALIKAKSNNPVILLDEIEKIGKSYKGDPEHALLQILDPSQNSSFVDHYVSIPVDLSKVMFICTANSLELTTPLLNRLELIEVPGYSREEKLQIARNHLVPLQVKENGVEGLVEFENEGLVEVIKYSNQLGVRQLERKLSKICRKVARKGVKTTINKEKVEEYLGKINKNQLWNGIGVVNGMAWTQLGGKVLTVEAILYRSEKQKIQITGQLGDVMKESVSIAFSWIKSNFEELAIVGNLNQVLSGIEKTKYLEEVSLHIHFPEGATKKDGPSAGITIVTCLTSLLIKVPPREHLSMTGQITLSGKVLPVGGIREKCIAAIYQGMKHIIIPYANLKDLEKIDQQLRKRAQFYPVKDIKQALSVAFPGFIQKNTPKL